MPAAVDRDRLLRAAATSHRRWFRRAAEAKAGHVESFGGLDLLVAGASGTIPFPRSRASLDDAVARIRALRLCEVGCWSLRADPVLGTMLVARGFQWGWQPHWMALSLAELAEDDARWPVVSDPDAHAADVPYSSPAIGRVDGIDRFAVKDRGRLLGAVALLVWRGTAGIYDMGVVPDRRREGNGRALTLAACRRARERGCAHAVLNAT